MSIYKVQKFLATLTPDELLELDDRIAVQKREPQRRLYKLLREQANKPKELDKAKVFEQIHQKEYTEADDAMFRNEMRLLLEKVQTYLIEREALNALDVKGQKDLLHLDMLLKRGLHAELESQYKKLYKAAAERLDHYHAHRMNRVYYTYLMLHKEITPDLMMETRELLLKDIVALKQWYRTAIATHQQGRVAIDATLKILHRPTNEVHIGYDTDLEQINNPLITFYEEVSKAGITTGEMKIAHATTAYKSIKQVADHFPEKVMDSLAILGGAYFQNRQTKEAVHYLKEAIDFSAEKKLTIRLDILFNYASILMKLEDYKGVIQLIDDHEQAIAANPKVKFRFECLHCFCHIFQGDDAAVLTVISDTPGKRPQSEYQYFRFIYTILPYLRSDYEGGYREAVNYVSYFNRKKGEIQFPQEKELALLFKRFYAILLAHPKKVDQQAQWPELQAALKEFVQQYPQYAEVQYVAWLKRQME